MINKIKVIAASAVLMILTSVSSHAIDGFSAGITGTWGAYEASGSEKVATSKQTDSGEIEATYGSIFAEVDLGMISLGVDHIPFEIDSEAVTNVRADTVTSGTNTAFVTVSDITTLYALMPIGEQGIYAKLGFITMEVSTNENLATGGSYGNLTLDGVTASIGYEHDANSEMFFRVSLDMVDFEDYALTNKNNSDISITGNLDGFSGSVTLGKRF